MNNFAVRVFLFFIGPIILISIIWNHWINREMVTTVNPAPLFSPVPETSTTNIETNDEIDVFVDPVTRAQEDSSVFSTLKKKEEPEHDEKIIYEMPLTNKFLVQ